MKLFRFVYSALIGFLIGVCIGYYPNYSELGIQPPTLPIGSGILLDNEILIALAFLIVFAGAIAGMLKRNVSLVMFRTLLLAAAAYPFVFRWREQVGNDVPPFDFYLIFGWPFVHGIRELWTNTAYLIYDLVLGLITGTLLILLHDRYVTARRSS